MKEEQAQPIPDHPSFRVYRRIAAFFLFLTAAVVALVFYVVFAKATVVVLSEQQEVAKDFLIDVAREPLPDEVKGDVRELEETLTDTFDIPQAMDIDVPVEGRVLIESELARAQTLIATTRLHTEDETQFRLKDTVTVPAFGSVEVDVVSDGVGKDFAVGNVTFTIPGLNPSTRARFTVTPVEPLTGGTMKMHVLAQSDVDDAAEKTVDRAREELLERIREEAEADGVPMSGEIVETEIVETVTDVAVGEEAKNFALSVTARVTATFYDAEQFRQRVHERLDEILPYDRALSHVTEDRTSVRIEKYDIVSGRAHLRVLAKGVSILASDAPYLDAERLAGVTVQAATTYLEEIDGISSASVKSKPFWSHRMPNSADRITIEVR